MPKNDSRDSFDPSFRALELELEQGPGGSESQQLGEHIRFVSELYFSLTRNRV